MREQNKTGVSVVIDLLNQSELPVFSVLDFIAPIKKLGYSTRVIRVTFHKMCSRGALRDTGERVYPKRGGGALIVYEKLDMSKAEARRDTYSSDKEKAKNDSINNNLLSLLGWLDTITIKRKQHECQIMQKTS